MKYWAHSEGVGGFKEPVIDHLKETARLAAHFAAPWGGEMEAFAAGMFHDLGKFSENFQNVLDGVESHIDHATPGATAIIKKYQLAGLAAAIAILGHHGGLIYGSRDALMPLLNMQNETNPAGKKYSVKRENIDCLFNLFENHGGVYPRNFSSDYIHMIRSKDMSVANALYIRMLFSALVDADFLATQAHFHRINQEYHYNIGSYKLDPEKSLKLLMDYLFRLRKKSKSSKKINMIRDELFSISLKQGENLPIGMYTYTAPTGSGKTLASLAFALAHAKKHGLERIIFVLPYLSLIEQTAEKYNEVLAVFGSGYILQDHSLANHDDELLIQLADNWDVPIVITTTVKFFEGLFACKTFECRRLHNIANSVVIFDEAQSMPASLSAPTLAAMRYLSDKYKVTGVFSTATQPAFDTISDKVKKYYPAGWKTEEIVTDVKRLFSQTRRVEISFRKERISWEQLSQKILDYQQAMVVVNLKRHAIILYELLGEDDCHYHVSTNMCPAHRQEVLWKINRRLMDGLPCRLVATQCVEAGVDLDFPVVYRSLAPLEAVIQAAGRCNRNGLAEHGQVVVFRPELTEERYPDENYKKNTMTFLSLLSENSEIDIQAPDTIKKYYQSCFKEVTTGKKLEEAIYSMRFDIIQSEYKWINKYGIEILVPYVNEIELFNQLVREARERGINNGWIRRARPISVNAYFSAKNSLKDIVEPLRIRDKKGKCSGIESGWYVLLDATAYSLKTGLLAGVNNLDYIV